MSDEGDIAQLKRRVLELERQLRNLPIRFIHGGTATGLPKGIGRGNVLMIGDDLNPGTWIISKPKFHG